MATEAASTPSLGGASDGANVLAIKTPSVFKSGTATSGSAAIWTPASGKRFRLLRAIFEMTADAAATAGAGPMTISLVDNATQIGIARSAYVPAASGAAAAYQTVMDLGPSGYLSIAVNNPLNITLSKALTSGTVRVVVMGVEE